MAIPLDRATVIIHNAVTISDEYLKELARGVSAKRRKEIERDMKLMKVIVKAIAWPYRHDMERYLKDNEDLLEEFGLE